MKKPTISILFLSPIISFLIACSTFQDSIPDNDNVKRIIAITNGFLIDGTGSEPIPDAIIIIEGEYIKSVGTGSTLDITAGAKIIDVQGSYILPGFMNTHVHSGYVANNLKEWAISGVSIGSAASR